MLAEHRVEGAPGALVGLLQGDVDLVRCLPQRLGCDLGVVGDKPAPESVVVSLTVHRVKLVVGVAMLHLVGRRRVGHGCSLAVLAVGGW